MMKNAGWFPLSSGHCLPGEGPAAQLLDEHLAAILNCFDVCALPRVVFTPVLLLFYCQTEQALFVSVATHTMT